LGGKQKYGDSFERWLTLVKKWEGLEKAGLGKITNRDDSKG